MKFDGRQCCLHECINSKLKIIATIRKSIEMLLLPAVTWLDLDTKTLFLLVLSVVLWISLDYNIN